MSNKKAKLVKGTYITEAMFDLMNPFYNLCIADSRGKNHINRFDYGYSNRSFKDLDQVPRIGDIVAESKTGTIIKVRQIRVTDLGKFMVTEDTDRGLDWYNLDEIHPIKLDHPILMDLGFETYGKDCCNHYKYRLILRGFINLKLTLDSYDGNLDNRVWSSEGKPLIHYLHELQDILRVSGRDRVINNSKYSHEVKVLTKGRYPLYLLPENNYRSEYWYTNK